LYVGTYTRSAAHVADARGRGIHVLDMDPATGSLVPRQEVGGIDDPTYLCVSPDGRNLHAVWEVATWPEALVSSYAIDPDTGELGYLGVQGTRGSIACHVVMDSRARTAFVANYGSGTVAAFPTRPDGSLAEASSVDQHEGSGPDGTRQQGPHAHCIVLAPDERFAFSADLGTDEVIGYRIDHQAHALIRDSRLAMTPGSGPRQLVFSPSGRHAWVTGELDATMSALAYDTGSGTFSLVGSWPMLPDDYQGARSGADVEVHPSGRFVYGSNRGHDSIAMFKVDEASGRLDPIGHRSSEGRTPRDFVISPDGRFLLVGNQDSDTIVVMPIDQATGELGPTAFVASVPTPACLRFGR